MDDIFSDIEMVEVAAENGDLDKAMAVVVDLNSRTNLSSLSPHNAEIVRIRLEGLRNHLAATGSGMADALTDIRRILASSKSLSGYDSEGNRLQDAKPGAMLVRF